MSRRLEFFHGSSREFSPGDIVLPWNEIKDREDSGGWEGFPHEGRVSPRSGHDFAWASVDSNDVRHYGKKAYRVRPVGDYEEMSHGRVRSKQGFEVLGEHR